MLYNEAIKNEIEIYTETIRDFALNGSTRSIMLSKIEALEWADNIAGELSDVFEEIKNEIENLKSRKIRACSGSAILEIDAKIEALQWALEEIEIDLCYSDIGSVIFL
jgi:hypothetical protein